MLGIKLPCSRRSVGQLAIDIEMIKGAHHTGAGGVKVEPYGKQCDLRRTYQDSHNNARHLIVSMSLVSKPLGLCNWQATQLYAAVSFEGVMVLPYFLLRETIGYQGRQCGGGWDV